jgi:MFS family permease
MGRLSDRYNVRLVIAVGVLVGTVSFLLLATTQSLWQFYLYFGVGGGICVGSTYTPVNATISKWFREKRALALGIALMGISVGQMVLSPLSAEIIAAQGWRTAYAVLAGVVFACGLPAVLLMGRRDPRRDLRAGGDRGRGGPTMAQRLREGSTVGQAARTAPFWMLMLTGFVISAGFYIVAAHIVPAATDAGMPATAAALILTVSSAAGIAGTFAAWWITRRLGERWTLLLLIVGEALGLFLFIFTSDVWAFYVVAAIFGFSFGAASPVRQAMAPPLFGLRAIGGILGFAYLAWAVGGVSGPSLAGLVFDRSGSYDAAFLVGGVLLLVGALSVYLWGGHTYRGSESERRPE